MNSCCTFLEICMWKVALCDQLRVNFLFAGGMRNSSVLFKNCISHRKMVHTSLPDQKDLVGSADLSLWNGWLNVCKLITCYQVGCPGEWVVYSIVGSMHRFLLFLAVFFHEVIWS
uniref:Uncharacterized protein n=1 Tax=Micrurus carvalhoi TaxID=3147026 RepID=A0A2H6NKQ4_9SAUR